MAMEAEIFSATKMRIPVRLKLRLKTGEVLRKTTKLKSQARLFVNQHASQIDYGIMKVIYSQNNDYWNAAEFSNYEEFDHILSQFTELDLVQTFI